MTNSQFYFEPKTRIEILKNRIIPFTKVIFFVGLLCLSFALSGYYFFSFELSSILFWAKFGFVAFTILVIVVAVLDLAKESQKLNEEKTVKLMMAIAGHTKLKKTLFNILNTNKQLLVYDVVRAFRLLSHELNTLYENGYTNLYNNMDQEDKALEISEQMEADVEKYKNWLIAVADILKDYRITFNHALPGQKP